MTRAIRGLTGLVAGYVGGAIIGGLLVALVSGNAHDKSLEIVMTAAFATGPIGAVIGAITGLAWRRRAP